MALYELQSEDRGAGNWRGSGCPPMAGCLRGRVGDKGPVYAVLLRAGEGWRWSGHTLRQALYECAATSAWCGDKGGVRFAE